MLGAGLADRLEQRSRRGSAERADLPTVADLPGMFQVCLVRPDRSAGGIVAEVQQAEGERAEYGLGVLPADR
jgi:hypothetical protein